MLSNITDLGLLDCIQKVSIRKDLHSKEDKKKKVEDSCPIAVEFHAEYSQHKIEEIFLEEQIAYVSCNLLYINNESGFYDPSDIIPRQEYALFELWGQIFLRRDLVNELNKQKRYPLADFYFEQEKIDFKDLSKICFDFNNTRGLYIPKRSEDILNYIKDKNIELKSPCRIGISISEILSSPKWGRSPDPKEISRC
ncbi:MAG: hypothetical protein Q8N88_04475 [Nanoarchaeota archaeon]|nr:hypothetical protein [Nanoarchaeota archaeon]